MGSGPVALDLEGPFLDRVFRVAPLVVVGTLEPDGQVDLAPKHMTMPVGSRHVAFVCTPDHATLRNLERSGVFTMSWLAPDAVLLASLAAAPRDGDDTKTALRAVPTRPATVVEGAVVRDAVLAVECTVDRVVDGAGRWRIVVGRVVHAEAAGDALLTTDEDPHDVLRRSPVLAYLQPDHVARIDRADRFPYHAGFRR